jgi:hypothetical protein
MLMMESNTLKMRDSTLRFYRVQDAFGCFSNFSPHPITLDGKEWPTTEHYFQAMKFAGTPHEEEIRLAKSPSEAAKMGRDRSRPLRSDWEHVKDDIMRKAVLAKFTQHPGLAQVLKWTKGLTLVEHAVSDRYWGDGGDGTGANMLGIILMETRADEWFKRASSSDPKIAEEAQRELAVALCEPLRNTPAETDPDGKPLQ